MDASKKSTLEKRIVLALAGVFLLVLIMGPMRSLGVLGTGRATTPAAAALGTVTAIRSVGAMLQNEQEQLNRQLASVNAPSTELPQAPPAYTAFDRRDPFKSYLPTPTVPTSTSAAEPNAPVAFTAQPKLPEFHVEGLLWGGPAPKAIIDGHLYGIHDVVNGVKIVSISRDGVTIEHLGEPVVYPVASGR